MFVDAGDVKPAELLAAMWRASRPAGFFARAPSPPRREDIAAALSRGYVGSLKGRVIQTRFGDGDGRAHTRALDPAGYDGALGGGALQGVVDKLRARTADARECHAAQ